MQKGDELLVESFISTLRTGDFKNINVFSPGNTINKIQICLATILTTAKYSVPMDRDFGLDATLLDEPSPRGMALLRAEIYEVINKYEPRVKILNISFEKAEDAHDDKIYPVVKWCLRDGVGL